ncbi:MAG: 30S ribosomal protein S4 [Bdellovibrionales bacterium]|nr:30S ribosomal protein S4 [Bdellovibrionales bacterium]
MRKLGQKKTSWKIQRSLMVELPGLGKPGALERRAYPPGQHGLARRKFSEFSLRLKEKQKLMFHYGLREEQLRRLVKTAKKGGTKNWMPKLIGILESRLDNVVFRLGFAGSTSSARQLVTHGKVLVDGKKTTIPSLFVKKGSEIKLTPKAYEGQVYQYSIKQPRLMLPDWLEYTSEGEHKVGKLRVTPDDQDIPFPFEQRLVVEFYSSI